MKKFVLKIVCAILLLMAGNTQAQTGPLRPIKPAELAISESKTTNLIFPYTIKSVDRGHEGLLVQKASQAENVLQVKASGPDFKETNLTVITSDGTLYSFILRYAVYPSFINLKVDDADYGGNPVVLFSSSASSEGRLQQGAGMVSTKKPIMRRPVDRKYSIGLTMCGIYIKDDMLYFQLRLENRSNIAYHIEQLRLFIADRKQAKRTASQELDVTPAFVEGNISVIGSKSSQVIVLAIPKFTIPDQKYFGVQLMEKNGGRHLKLHVSNKLLLGVRSF